MEKPDDRQPPSERSNRLMSQIKNGPIALNGLFPEPRMYQSLAVIPAISEEIAKFFLRLRDRRAAAR